jgi:hypothetical protein
VTLKNARCAANPAKKYRILLSWGAVWIATNTGADMDEKKNALRICGAKASMVGVTVGNRQHAPSK